MNSKSNKMIHCMNLWCKDITYTTSYITQKSLFGHTCQMAFQPLSESGFKLIKLWDIFIHMPYFPIVQLDEFALSQMRNKRRHTSHLISPCVFLAENQGACKSYHDCFPGSVQWSKQPLFICSLWKKPKERRCTCTLGWSFTSSSLCFSFCKIVWALLENICTSNPINLIRELIPHIYQLQCPNSPLFICL